MMRPTESPLARRRLRVPRVCLLGLAVLLFLASPAAAQKNKGKGKNAPPSSGGSQSLLALPDDQAIDYLISEMLGAWQIGDIDRLHKAYGDDVVMVSGTWGPPVIGWGNYLQAYQQQQARMQMVRVDRLNTYIKVDGSVAWANYQWDFTGTVDGQPMNARGHTSLVLEKRAARWVIVHNHTSLVSQSQPAASPAPTNTAPQESKPPAR
jgi:ketosteroid isomerase-like protein